jgi:hypothetical protein
MDGTWSPSEIKKTARIIQISSKRPTENTERKWWEPPNKMWKMDQASSEYHTRSKTLPKRIYLDHRGSQPTSIHK